VIVEEHYETSRRGKRREQRERRSAQERELIERFASGAEFLRELVTTLRSIAPIHLREILALAARYRREEVESALARALRDGTPAAGYVRQLIERRHPTGHLGQIALETPKGLALGAVDPGAAEGYDAIFAPNGAGEASESDGDDHDHDLRLAADHGVEPSVVRDLAQCEFVRARRNLILAGGVGTGKTYLARTLGVEALERGFRVLSFNTAELLDTLYLKRESFHFGKAYARVRDAELLILDDLAYMPYAPEKVEFLFSLIVDRHELGRGSTIVTSNTDVTEWWQYLPSKAMGMAFSDRLLDGAQGIRFAGESIRQSRSRRRMPPPTPPEKRPSSGEDDAQPAF